MPMTDSKRWRENISKEDECEIAVRKERGYNGSSEATSFEDASCDTLPRVPFGDWAKRASASTNANQHHKLSTKQKERKGEKRREGW